VTRPVALGLAYLGTAVALVAWWLGLQAAARAGGGLTVGIAFGVPAVVWAVFAVASTRGRPRR
jgi:predicted MFS family arabinose efflux permease